jgi:AraC family transcriptional regulator
MKNGQQSLVPDTALQQVNRSATVADYRSRINAAMLFIQANANQPSDVQAIAAAANFSAFHFHRIFVAYVGQTLGEYLKRVRMIKAAALLASDRSIAEVATEVGYETASAFIQVFKKVYGVTPQSFKQTRLATNIHYPDKPAVKTATRPTLPVQFRHLPDWHVYYVRKQGLSDENYTKVADEAFKILYCFLARQNVRQLVTNHLGIIHDLKLISYESHRFDAGVTLQEPLMLEPGSEVQSCIIESGKWAVFSHQGPYNTLWQTWNWIYQYWCPASGVEIRDVAPFEVYLQNMLTTPANELVTEIYIPIQ